MSWQGKIYDEASRRATFEPRPQLISSGTIGIIAVPLHYAKVPGNVANPTTFDFPVVYEEVDFEIEQLFAGDPAIEEMIVGAAKSLEAQGVDAIIGACGFFAHFQQSVANAVNVPVFMSSLLQAPLIEMGLKADQKIAVIAADAPSVTPELLSHVGAKPDRLLVFNIGDKPAFQAIRWSKENLDNGALIDEVKGMTAQIVAEHPEVGAILLECSDLPPYSVDAQVATKLPVYDFITLINWVHQSVAQKPYYGTC